MGTNGESTPGFPVSPGNASVAIIEDNAEIVELYVMLVKARGLQVCFIAGDGDAGVKMFREAEVPPDIVLIDHRMPIKSGLEAMKEIQALRPVTRFIFVSADENMKAGALAAGATAFLTKPVSLKEIADAIEKALAVRTLEK